MIKVSTLRINPSNPRTITKDKFAKLVKSVKEFPRMMELRPMIVDKSGIVIGGNMRLKAIQQLGMKEIPASWVKTADKLSKAEQRRFIAVDNLEFGTWSDEFANLYDLAELSTWGFDAKDLDIDFGELSSDTEAEESTTVKCVCPKCGKEH